MQLTHFGWEDLSLHILKAKFGDHRGQTAFEFLALLVCTVAFGRALRTTGATIRGDNLGTLRVSNDLSSAAPAMNAIARELAWRTIVYRWRYRLLHLPAKQNDKADALSRLLMVPPRLFPTEALTDARFVAPPNKMSSCGVRGWTYNEG